MGRGGGCVETGRVVREGRGCGGAWYFVIKRGGVWRGCIKRGGVCREGRGV